MRPEEPLRKEPPTHGQEVTVMVTEKHMNDLLKKTCLGAAAGTCAYLVALLFLVV